MLKLIVIAAVIGLVGGGVAAVVGPFAHDADENSSALALEGPPFPSPGGDAANRFQVPDDFEGGSFTTPDGREIEINVGEQGDFSIRGLQRSGRGIQGGPTTTFEEETLIGPDGQEVNIIRIEEVEEVQSSSPVTPGGGSGR